jgi:exopolysaccharide biosynthesis polyprenyl glycosylphosphotransferase
MIANRQQGLVNAYAVIVALIAVFFLLVYTGLVEYLPWIHLSPPENLIPYCTAVFVGMLISVGGLRKRGYSLYLMGWFAGANLALRQIFHVSGCLFGLMFVLKDHTNSRLFFGSYLLFLGIYLVQLHRVFPSTLANWLFGRTSQMPTLFIGSARDLFDLDDWISNRGHLGIRSVGLVSDEPPTRADTAIAPYLGKVAQLREVIRSAKVRQVVLLKWMADTEALERIIEDCEAEGCRFLIHNDLQSRFARPLIPIKEGGRDFLSLKEEPLEDPINRATKRLMDIAISLPVVLLVLPPLCLFVWAVQCIQAPGPLFFVRPRGGKNRTEFNMLKFRSMYVSNRNINQQATANDDRIYPLGRFLRKSSLDEFPQFVNVLFGEMSVVGPRPHLPQHDTEFSLISNAYRVRALVKPGITGLAQVNGYRGEITEPEKLHRRVHWDLVYVSEWSLGMDLHIVVRTAIQVVRPPSAAY